MNSKEISMPFAPPTPTTRDQIIAQGSVRLKELHKQNVESHRVAFEVRAQKEWEQAEQNRKNSFIAKFTQDHYQRPTYSYASYTPGEAYRVSLEPSNRVEGCMAVKLYDQALYCLLACTPNRTATVPQVQEWYVPYMDVVGDSTITEDVGVGGARRVVTHAAGLSKQLSDLLTGTWLIEVKLGKVTWKDREAELSEY